MLDAKNPKVAEFLKLFNTPAGPINTGNVQFDLIENFRVYCTIKYEESTVRNHVLKIQEFERELKDAEIIESLNEFDRSWDYSRFREILLYFVWRMQKKGNKQQTILKKMEALNSFFIFLKDREIVSLNPIGEFRDANLSNFKIVREERQAVSLEKLEEIIVDGSVETKNRWTDEICPFKTHLLRTCFLVLSKDLLRTSEFCALNVGNFYLNEKYFGTGDFAKVSGKRRPLDDQTIWHIKVYWWIRQHVYGEVLTPESPAFLGMKYKTRMHPNVLLGKVKHAGTIAGVHEEGGPLYRRFTTHNFRHTGTTLLADTPIKDTYIIEIRGDAHRRSMDAYHHISTEKLISEYLTHMPEFKIGVSPADEYYMKEIDEALKRDNFMNLETIA